MLVIFAWIISHDNRFKAACAQRGVYDLNTFWRKCMEISSIILRLPMGTKN
jgi:hypothetical protein